MEHVLLADAAPYEPAGHVGVLNRLLVGKQTTGVEAVSIWHGAIESQGGSDTHVHADSVQVYIGLEGALVVTGETGEVELGAGDAVIIPAGERHAVRNPTATAASLLVVSAPALR